MLRKTILFAFILLLTSMVSLFAEEITSDGYVFDVIDGTAEIVDYEGDAAERHIPASVEYQGKNIPVTSIGEDAFSFYENLISVTIPGSVTSIGEAAFSFCKSMTSITIPNSVTSIGEGAFLWCESLTSITIPESVTSIGEGAFFESKNLKLSVYYGSYAQEYAEENQIPYSLMID